MAEDYSPGLDSHLFGMPSAMSQEERLIWELINRTISSGKSIVTAINAISAGGGCDCVSLQTMVDSLNTNLDAIEANTNQVSKTATSIALPIGVGVTPVSILSATFTLSLSFTGTINGVARIPGSVIEFSGYGRYLLNAIPYNILTGSVTLDYIS